MKSMRDGLLLVDKEPGCTSHDVVQRVRRLLGQKKVGHCGTLDPDATGLLVLTLGRGTRLTRFLIRAPKAYAGVIRLGVATDTYDAAGEVVERRDTSQVTEEQVLTSMTQLEGKTEQKVPPYCAKKTQGVKYYELARKGAATPETTKQVEIFEFRATGPLKDDRIPFLLRCSTGTYARALAQEVGERVGCGAHLESLRRLQVGPFRVENALTLGVLEQKVADPGDFGDSWIPFHHVPLPFPELRADAQQERRIRHGQTVLARGLEGDEGDWIRVTNQRQELIAVGTVNEKIGESGVAIVRPRVVFN